MPTARSSKDVDAGDVWPGDAVDSPDASSDEAPSFVPSEAVDSPDVSSDEAPTFVPSQASSPREKDKQVGRELQEELTRHLLGGRRRSDVGQILLATVAVFVFWGSLHSLLSVGWLVLFVVLAGVRAAWRGWATRATTEVLKLRSMIRGDIWVSAVLWGVLSILMVGEPLATLAFLMVIVAGLVAVATSTLVADGRSFLGFTGILIGSLVATIVLSGTSRDHGSLLLIVALFTPFMVSVQRQANAVLRSQIESATRLRLSEEETVRGRDFLKALVAHAPSAILILDQGGRVRNANPAFERITGFALDEVRGHDLASLITDAEQAGELTAFLETIKEGAQSITELRLEKKGGDPMWIRLAGTAAGSEAAGSTILIGEDVTAQVAARAAQEEARAEAEGMANAKSAFLANMSHEIRTPMNGVMGMLELLLDTDLDDEQRRSAEIASSSAASLLTILNDVLDFSKSEAGHLSLEEIPFDLSRMLQDVTRLMTVTAAERSNEMALDLGDGIPPLLRGDPGRLRQVITNLVSNAIKFTENGEVVVATRLEENQDGKVRIALSVRDTGVGIPADKLETIFAEFSQADVSTTRTYGGTGLGLTISRRIVELMNGQLTVTSEVGKGTEFRVVVQLTIADAEADAPLPRPVEGLRDKRILIVDDNDTARRIAREAVTGARALITEAAGADDGLAALIEGAEAGHPFDAAIIDSMMPEKDGFALADEIRERSALDGVRLLMLTSGADAHGPKKAREHGIMGYLPKPISRSDLVMALQTLLGMRSPSEGEERRVLTKGSLAAAWYSARVLLAEDNPVNEAIAVAMLHKRGHRVDVARNGREAVEMSAARNYDVILMDVQMPEMDGLEATQVIRTTEAGKNLPIIAVTAHALEEARRKCAEAGMSGFVTKPYSPEELFEAVEKWHYPDGKREAPALD